MIGTEVNGHLKGDGGIRKAVNRVQEGKRSKNLQKVGRGEGWSL